MMSIEVHAVGSITFASTATGLLASGERHRQSCAEANCCLGSESRATTQKPVTVNAVAKCLGGSSFTVGGGA